jgi:hypothetical protein
MKKYIYIISAIAAAIACSPQEMQLPDDSGYGSETTLNAFFEDLSTRSTLVDGTKVYWVPGDEIKVFAGSSSARFSTDIKENSAECSFTGTVGKADKYLAFYPYKEDVTCDGSVINVTLPATQDAVEGNVANGYLFSAGASSSDGSIRFRNLVSGICFSVESEGVVYVELKGNDGEVIAGALKATVTDSSVKAEAASGEGDAVIRLNAPGGGSFKTGVNYYIVCIPTVLEKGLTLRMVKEDETAAQFKIERKVELKRSVFGRISAADEGLPYKGAGFPEGELPADNEIWYTTIDMKPLGDIGNQPGCTLVSNTFENGVGVLRFSGPLTSFGTIEPYEERARLTGILLPDCVESIGDNALMDMAWIEEFRIPAALREAGKWPFVTVSGSSLERFTGHHVSEDGRCVIVDGILYGFAPAGITSYEIPDGVVTISEGAFARTEGLRSVVIPAGVKSLEKHSFCMSGLESITIPSSVDAIDTYAFLYSLNLRNLLGDSYFISKDRKFLYDTGSMIPNMMFYFAGRDDVSYEIPEGIMAIEYYTFYGCNKLESLTFPESMSFIAGTAFDGCDKLNTLLGSHVTSDHKGYLNGSGTLQFLVPDLGEDYVVPDEVTALGDRIFTSKQGLRSVTMGDQVTSIGLDAFWGCHDLRTVTLSAGLVSIGASPFAFCENLESVYFRSILPPSCTEILFTENPLLTVYVPSVAFKLYSSDSTWEKYWDDMEPYEYTDLPEPDFYISTDYSKEGEVAVYQRASEGKGIDIVFMGDAYSDREVASGKYISDMKKCAEEFFAVEPYTTFRELFNVYFVTTVSATEGYERGGRSLGTVLGLNTYISGNDDKCYELALKAVGDSKRLDEVLVVVCGNQDLSGPARMAGTCFMSDPETWDGHDYACGRAVTYFLKTDESFERTGTVIRHEAGGHGFAKLADEYHYSGTVSASDRIFLRERAPYMWYSNVDVTSDPAKVKWAWFLSDDRYKDEVGMHEGGYTYLYGVWRPSDNSIMNDNMGGFNAPSRYTIWYRIHKLAYGSAWNGTYEDFAAYDAVNRAP